MKDTLIYPKTSLNLGGILRSCDVPLVMGIINATPDSFYEKSRLNSIENALVKAEEMITHGVDIIDIGGYSSRPGAAEVSETEEQERVIPLLKALISRFPNLLISIDTFRSRIANEAIDNGAVLINDISAGNIDSRMFEVVAKHKSAYCMMHMRGTPQNMMDDCAYENLMNEIIQYFSVKIDALKEKGIINIIIDPGFGFSKSIEQNFELLNNLDQLKLFNLPILAGLSRKSMIYKTLGIDAAQSLNGTTALNTVALLKGASLLRVHDVKEAKETISLIEAIKTSR